MNGVMTCKEGESRWFAPRYRHAQRCTALNLTSEYIHTIVYYRIHCNKLCYNVYVFGPDKGYTVKYSLLLLFLHFIIHNFIIYFCIVLQVGLLLEELFLSSPFSRSTVCHHTLPRGYISQYTAKQIYSKIMLPDHANST